MNVTCTNCRTVFDRVVQKGVDIAICTALLGIEYDEVVLTAGDGDFLEAITHIRPKGKSYWIPI